MGAIADCQSPGATVVGGGDEGAGTGGTSSGEHGTRNFLRRAKGDGADRRTRSTQKGAERAGGFGSANHIVEEWDEFFAKRLVQMIGESATEFFVFARGECGGDGAGVLAVFHGLQAIDTGWQEPARLLGGNFEIRDQQNEVELRGNGEALPLSGANN